MEVWSLFGKITMQGFSAAEAQLTALEKKVKANEAAFASLRKTGLALVAVTAAIAGGSLKAAIDFESAFAGVRKTVEATEEQFAELSQGIKDLSKELPVTATEIAGVAEAAGQLGIATEDIMAFTEVMVKLGMATNLTADQAATDLARFANITNLAADEYDNLGAAIVALGNNSATTESEIVDMAMRIAGAGTTAGLTQQQILALAASLSSMGLRAEAGGTAISQTFLTMNSAVLSSGEELEKFAEIAGMSASQFADVYNQDASAALVAFISGLGRMNDAGQDATGALEELGLGGIRVTDTMLRAANAQDILTESINLADEAWKENTALQEEVDKRNETAAAKLTILKNKVVDVAVNIGDALIPIVTSLVEKISPVIDGISKWVKENQDLVKWILAIAGTGGALMLFVGLLPKAITFINSFIGGIKLLSNVTKIVTGIQWLWNAAMTANPIGLLVTAIAGLIAAGIALWKNWEKITNWFNNLFGKTAEKFIDTADTIEERSKELTEELKAIYDKQLDAKLGQLESERNAAQSAHDAEVESLRELYGISEEEAEENSKTLIELAEETAEKKQDLLDEEMDAVKDAYYERLELIDKEYAERLKLLDAETQAAIAEKQAEIDALDEEQRKKDEARRKEAEKEEKARLKAAIDEAETAEEKAEAEEELAEYLAELAEEEADRKREAERDALRDEIDNIKTEAEAKQEALEAEKEAEIAQQGALLQSETERIANEKTALDTALEEEKARLAEELAEKIAIEDAKLETLNTSLAAQKTAIEQWHADMIQEESLYQSALEIARQEVGEGGKITTGQRKWEGYDPEKYDEYWTPEEGYHYLPRYAQGGTIDEPTLLTSLATGKPYAIAGEAGTEHVVPEGKTGGTIVNNYTVNAVIREESDIKKVARELYKLQESGNRGVGYG